MIYKLFNEPTPTYGPITQILVNRGFDADNLLPWINAKYPDSINSPTAFGRDAVIRAVEFLHEALINESRICVIVDADCDGFSSGAIIFNFLVAIGVKLDNISYILHTGKQHGLADTIDRIPQDTDLVVIPDAGTNDIDQMQELVDNGKKILCADHHEADNYLKNNNVVIINNQISDYPNKDLAGAGVMWQVCRYYDSVYDTDEAYSLIDLAALGCCGDMMNFQSIETKAIIQEGFNHIKNPFFYYMVEKNSFSINKMGGINYMSIAFYVVPFINAIVRSGTMEEKDLIFKSMLQAYAFEKIESGKRGHKGELVPRVEEGIRVAANVKARQTKLQDSTMLTLEQKIQDDNMLEDNILLFKCEPNEVEKNIAG